MSDLDRYQQLARDCWHMIRALGIPLTGNDDAAIRLIAMACASAAESERIALGFPPKGVRP